MGASSWIAHVKAYHKKHGGTYAQALKKAAVTWKAKKKGGAAVSEAPAEKKKGRRRKR